MADENTELNAKPGGRLSPPESAGDSGGSTPGDLPAPDAEAEPEDVDPGSREAPADEDAEASSVADEPTEPTKLDDPDQKDADPNDAARDETDRQQDSGDEESRTSDAAELTSKLKRLRDKKQAPDGGDAPAEEAEPSPDDEETRREIHEASAAEMWEHRSEVDETGSDDGLRTDEQTEAVAAGDFKLRHAFETPHEVVNGLSSLPGSDLVATCGADGSACLWTLGGRRRLTLTSEENALNGIAFTPDGRVLAAASSGAHIHLWLLPESLQNPDSTIKHTRLDEHDGEVTGVAVAPSGKLLLSGSRDGTARIWSLVDAACMAVLDDHGGPVVDVSWGKLPVTADDDGAIRYWDQEGRPINDASGFGDITSVATHETTTCWGTAAGEVHVQTTGRPEPRRSHQAAARDVDFGPGGLLVTGGADGTLLIYDADETEPGHRLDSEASVASVFARQNLVGAGGEDGRVYLYSRG